MHTKDILADELMKVGLQDMSLKAREGYYHDFLSPLALPEMQLVDDLGGGRERTPGQGRRNQSAAPARHQRRFRCQHRGIRRMGRVAGGSGGVPQPDKRSTPMTHDEYGKEIQRLKAKADAAAAADNWGIVMVTIVDLCDFALDHPEHWPEQNDPAAVRHAIEDMMATAEKQLGMR
jgi:hypothetical protein